ncbi:MAG: AAA family ATPase [Bacteroidales bacterium]|nr:AAA family ATPase [Bacteroidales bacterium]
MENDDELLKAEADEIERLPQFKQEYDLTGVRPPWGSVAGGLKYPRYTLRYGGADFAPMGGIHVLAGQSGHGKTMLFSMMMAAVLSGEYGGVEWIGGGEPPSVLYVDTEMEPENTQLVIARVHRMAGWPMEEDNERLRWLALRTEESVERRWLYVLKAIEEMQPTVVFLDGLLDMVADFNSNTEATTVVWRCMAMAQWYDISIWCVAHQNFGGEKMTGHLGSILNRKVTDEFAVKKNKEGGVVSFSVEQRKSRGKPVEDMLFTVMSEDTGDGHMLAIPCMCETGRGEEEEDTPVAALSVMEVMDAVLGGGGDMSMGELETAIKVKLGVGTRKADEYIRAAEEKGIVRKEKIMGLGRPRTMYRMTDGGKIITKEDENEVPF